MYEFLSNAHHTEIQYPYHQSFTFGSYHSPNWFIPIFSIDLSCLLLGPSAATFVGPYCIYIAARPYESYSVWLPGDPFLVNSFSAYFHWCKYRAFHSPNHLRICQWGLLLIILCALPPFANLCIMYRLTFCMAPSGKNYKSHCVDSTYVGTIGRFLSQRQAYIPW